MFKLRIVMCIYNNLQWITMLMFKVTLFMNKKVQNLQDKELEKIREQIKKRIGGG